MKKKNLVLRGFNSDNADTFGVSILIMATFGASLLYILGATPVGAVTSISQGYTADKKLPVGSIVSQENNSSDKVTAALTSNVDSLLGVVIHADSSLLSLSNGQQNQMQVATSGTVSVLVSDINGKVTKGDHITASPIAGVGMKANGNVRIIGIAQNDLRGSKQTYTDKAGKKHQTTIGEIPVLVNVAYYFKEPEKTVVPAAVQNVANALAGRAVSTVPILISLAIFIVTLITVVSIIYSMIRSSIISVGRNPMSQSAIYRNLVQLSALVLMILSVGFGSIYMVLTKL